MNNPNMPGGFHSYGNQADGYGYPQNMRFQTNIPTPTFQNMLPQTDYQPRMSLYNIPQQEFGDSLINRATIGVEQGNIYRTGQVDGNLHGVIENRHSHLENRSTQVPGFIPPFDTQTRVINPLNPQINPHINPHIPHINPHINPQMNPSYPSQNLHASYTQSQFTSSSPSLSQREVYIPETIPAFETQRLTINNTFMHNPGPITTNISSTHQASIVSIQQNQYNICCNCRQSTGNLISLHCSDNWCTDCLKRVCIANSFQYAFIECVCRARLKREYFINIFGGEYQLSKLEDDYYTKLNDQFKPEPFSMPAHPITSYHQASNLYSQPSIPSYPQASSSYSQPSMPSYPQATNSYLQTLAPLNTSHYPPTIPSSNSIPSLYSTYQQHDYLASFFCDYCMNSISEESNRITLDCDHKICKPCLNTYITIQRSNYINPTCKFDNSQISTDIISANLFPFLQTIETFRQYLPHTD
jgi:hypothetical protein